MKFKGINYSSLFKKLKLKEKIILKVLPGNVYNIKVYFDVKKELPFSRFIMESDIEYDWSYDGSGYSLPEKKVYYQRALNTYHLMFLINYIGIEKLENFKGFLQSFLDKFDKDLYYFWCENKELILKNKKKARKYYPKSLKNFSFYINYEYISGESIYKKYKKELKK